MLKSYFTAIIGTVAASIFIVSNITKSLAQNITLDGSLGKQEILQGPNYNILQSAGQTSGNNLFHSFGKFNLNTNEAAIFHSNGNIQNILSRVTGGNPSSIDGLIQTLGKDVNFFLINPSGIVFGKNARLDVSGSFFASTADTFIFGDGSEFSAVNPQAAPLLKVNITPGLQYGENYSSTTIQNTGNLKAGRDLKLFAGNLDLQGQLQARRDLNLEADTIKVRDSVTNPFIAAAGGKLLIQGRESVDIFALNHSNSGLFSGGDMVLKSALSEALPKVIAINGDVHFYSGGGFRVEKLDGSKGDLFSLYDPIIRSQGDVSFLAYGGASLHILAGGKVDINSAIITNPDTTGQSINPEATPNLANVTLSDGTSLVIDGSKRATLDIRAGVDPAVIGNPLGTLGDSGIFFDASFNLLASPANNSVATSADINIKNISITAPNGTVFLTNQYKPNLSLPGGDININGNGLFGTSGINARGFGGDGGDIFFDARGGININTNVFASASSFTSGNAGDITLIAKDNINLTSGSGLLSEGLLGGNITLKSDADISIVNASIFSSNYASSSKETGGFVKVIGRSLSVNNGTQMGTATIGQANAGDVVIQTDKTVSLDGENEQGLKTALQSEIFPGARGNGGNIQISTGSLFVTNGAQIGSTTFGEGNSGEVNINTSEKVLLDGQASNGFPTAIASQVNSGAKGNSGNIEFFTDYLSVTNGAVISANTFAEGNAGIIKIDSQKEVIFDGENSSGFTSGVSSQVNSAAKGNAGGIEIKTGSLTVTNGSELAVSTSGEGNAGNIKINATEAVSINGERNDGFPTAVVSRVASGGQGNAGSIEVETGSFSLAGGAFLDSSTFGKGNAGTVKISALDTISLDGESSDGFSSSVSSTIQFRGEGNAGGIEIDTGSLFITNGALITVNTTGLGDAGNVKITAREKVSLDGEGSDLLPSAVASQVSPFARGNSGEINIKTGTLSLTNGARLNTSTFGISDAGNITIIARDAVSFDGEDSEGFPSGILSGVLRNAKGNGANIKINTDDSLFITNGALISVSTAGLGNAGGIELNAKKTVLFDGQTSNGFSAGTVSQVNPGAIGNAGKVEINTDSLFLTNSGQVSTATSGKGDAGNIIVTANTVDFTNGGLLRTTTASNNKAGNITLNIKDKITLNGTETGIFANTTENSTGNGGSIIIDPEVVNILDGAEISVNSSGTGIGGDIDLAAGRLNLENGKITAETRSNTGGDITLNIQDLLLLRNNSQVSTTAGNEQFGGDGGNININSPFIVALPQEDSNIAANAFSGNGGRVNINTRGLFGIFPQSSPTNNSDITASSQSGINGEINIDGLDIDPNRGVIELPENLVDASEQVSTACTSWGRKNASTFISTGRGGLPLNPNQPLRQLGVITSWVDLPSQNVSQGEGNKQQTEERRTKIIEARKFVVDKNGEIFLAGESEKDGYINSGLSCG